MAAAYFVLHNRVDDPERMGEYIPKAVETIFAHGGEVLVVADECTVIEGSTEWPRTVVIKFESRAKAEAWYHSPEYEAVRPLRLSATDGYGVLVDAFEM